MKRKRHVYRLPFYIGLYLLILLIIIRALLPFWLRDYVNRKLSEVPEYRGHVAAVTLHLWRGAYQNHHFENGKKNGDVPGPFFFPPPIYFSLQGGAPFGGARVCKTGFFSPPRRFFKWPGKRKTHGGRG